ncbi:hypothetical protein [uncultured Fibrobacter sp.]|uniref:hypothetical protein n=1 Tax=uncultured Fibrobacter sp. TaxID=261512 RepID=UPI0026365851|nr:hypothetical protein [uncultured Fibrobacter sp.]
MSILLFSGCAGQKEPEVDFRPLQLRWVPIAGEADSLMPRKDECVILLTGKLMADPLVNVSTEGELSYVVAYGRSPENPEILYFRGTCADESIAEKPECRWSASCDKDLKTVVKFDNGV